MKRRNLLKAIGIAPVAAVVPAVAMGRPADPLVDWYKAWAVVNDDWAKFDDNEDPAAVALWKERHRLSVLISNAKATTIEGALAQVEWFDEDFGYIVDDMLADDFANSLRNIRASLKVLAG